MSKEEYELLNGMHYDDANYVYVGIDINAVGELVDKLRTVARAAQNFAAPGYEHPQQDWRKVVIEALDALPAWVLDE